MMDQHNPIQTVDLSIVIPVYNEQTKIAADIISASEFMTNQGFSGQIIIIDDGSTDNTAQTAKAASLPAGITLQVESFTHNQGKGAAVKAGILRASGRTILVADSGVCVPFTAALDGIHLINTVSCSIAIGSRKLTNSRIHKPQTLYRRFCSWLFHKLVVLCFPALKHLTDTQCGFKVFDANIAKELASDAELTGFLFDIEFLLLAHTKGYRIKEFPIAWTCDRDTRLSPSRHSMSVLREIRQLRKRFGK